MDPSVYLDLPDDREEKELNHIKAYHTIVGYMRYAELATRPDI
jgi:hypothetical protein